MTRLWLAILALPLLLWTATFKLYMKDGEWHLVREYKVEADRVRFYSIERSDWEEVPLEIVDLKRTEREIRERQDKDKDAARLIDEEDNAEREARREAARVPGEPGVYFVDGSEIKALKVAESKLNHNKRRSILQWMSPIPIVAGKATLELDGETAAIVVAGPTPEFYIRLTSAQRFGMIRLTPGKGIRLVEKISIVPVSKEMIEEREMVETFRRQLGESFYKIWPMEPLPPGEYAAIEYTEGKVNLQIWDFSLKAAASK